MRVEERRREIIRQLDEHNSVRVGELSNIFEVTEETIRRDLERLETEGYLKRTHGGAFRVAASSEEIEFRVRNMRNRHEKQLIGQKAAELVSHRDVIILDASTTALQLVYHLKDKKDIVIITHALKVIMALAGNRDITIIGTGGTFEPRTLSFVGPLVENAFTAYNIQKAFISCKGVTLEEGITESTETQAKVKAEIIKGAKEIILLADHDKFGQAALATVASVTAIHKLIADPGTPAGELDKFRHLGVEVIIPEDQEIAYTKGAI